MLLLALAACDATTHEAHRMVKRAELLADILPDSTVCLIDSVLRMPVSFSERERMDMVLLQAEALFGCRDVSRNVSKIADNDTLGDVSGNVSTLSPLMDDDFFDDHAIISTSPELERAAAYYARKKQYAKAARAALYSGFVQQHYNEKEVAMRSFKEAEEYGRLAVDSLTVARAEYLMGKMLLDDGREQEALAVLQAANLSFGDHFIEKALVMNMMGVCYLLQGNTNNAEICLHQGLLDAKNKLYMSNKANRKLLNNFAVLYRTQGKYDQALIALQQTIEDSNLDDTEQLMHLLNLGNVYFDIGIIDTAAVVFQHMKDILPTANTKKETEIAAYGALFRFAKSQNNESSALQYREKHEKLLYDVMIERQEQTIYRIQKQYDYESVQNKINQVHARMQRIIALGIVLLLCIVALFQYRSSQRNKKEAEANANLFHFMQQNKALVESNMAQERKVVDATQQLSDVLYARFKAMQKLDYCLKNPKDKIALKDLEKEVFGDGDHWVAVKEVLMALYPNLWETIELKYPQMDEMERRVCMLSRLKLSRLGEATLLGISTSVLDKYRTKVRKIVEQDGIQ